MGRFQAFLAVQVGDEYDKACRSVHHESPSNAHSELDIEDMRLPTARAYETGELVVINAAELRTLTRQIPKYFLHNPFPMAVASAPLVAGGRILGCLSVRWSRTQAPDRPVAPGDLRHVRRVAQNLADRLLPLAEAGMSMEAPSIPTFIRPAPVEGPEPGSIPASNRLPGGVSSTTFLYQLGRLSTELAAAVQVRDVLTAAQSHVMAPFGATALMLCRVQEDRLRVVGSSGFSRDEVGRVEGTPLSRSTPATDAVNRVEARLYNPDDASSRGAPRAAADPDDQPRACMPLIANGRSIGCCIMEFPAPWRRFPEDEEIALAVLMLGQIGQALDRIYAHEVEHAFARTMQQSLLPPTLPHRPETVVTSRYLPATEGAAVGGDWYDVIPLPDGGIGLAIGDVEGHSVQAASLMGHLRSAVLAYATEGHEPNTILERMDGLLRALGASRYATCCCLWLQPATGVAKIATAGHPLPLISPAPGKLMTLNVPIGLPLGLGDGHHYEQREVTLPPGSVTALFTDGLLDTRALGPDAALTQLTAALTDSGRENMDPLADHLISERQSRKTLDDDLALLLMRYDGIRPGERRDVARFAVQRYNLQAVSSVRHYLKDLFRRWGTEPLLDDMQLALCEVVTNALIHAQSDVDIRLRRQADGVRVEVQDRSPQPPIPTVIVTEEAMNAEAESGRGLLIVDALATAWGSSPAGWGKTTWIEMTLPQQSSSAA
ncbi:SpoIIE family protein phosphatase [Streptomyces sp. NBC_01669]|uniref:SpoIIE family protein phosphatase n=1 Tax=Streptomyces sp. NBC_01669 TaxID=2975909 RepID=UPI002252E3D6|nr:SpoIIE family protein phosphatase [Streptomyces sp. NBC_01669]MCX4538236.1 SpoIIE family protein phosphatase [Streptomyces sp. NBC_01669]